MPNVKDVAQLSFCKTTDL